MPCILDAFDREVMVVASGSVLNTYAGGGSICYEEELTAC
jgi:hypothetical protein